MDATDPSIALTNRFAYAWASAPTNPSYTADPDYAYNAMGGAITIRRTDTGAYAVRFGNMAKGAVPTNKRETVLVTPHGGGAVRCVVLNWGDVGADLEVRVRCVDPAGAPKNTKFTILVVGHNSLQGRSGFAWANEPSTPSYIPTTLYSWTTASDLIDISRFGPGRYIVDLKLPRPRGGLPETYFVTTFGDPNDMCKIISWDANATVFCYDKSGVYTDAYYDILLVEQGRPGRRLGFAWANQQAVGSYFPSAQYRRNSSLGSVFITRSGTGRYSVRFEGLVRAPGRTETVQVSSYGAFYTYCTVVNWYNTFPSDMLVNVECRDRLGALADSRYTVLLIE